jgi:adenosylcobyric acid synthase
VADTLSQVVVLGEVLGQQSARDYFAETGRLAPIAFEALERLRRTHEVVLIEGAGSCAEVNLRSREFANFPAAHAGDASVLLVADIDRGGVFAQVVGTLAVMPEQDRARVVAILINRFRGDVGLFEDGRRWLEDRVGLPVVGVVPHDRELALESEDALPLDALVDPPRWQEAGDRVRIAVLGLPHLSNFTDFDPLRRQACIELHYLRKPRDLDCYSLLIVPGSKAVCADLNWLRRSGWETPLLQYRAAGGRVLGVCGGYQMIGETLADPHELEGAEATGRGLGLLAVDTEFKLHKVLCRTRATSPLFGARLCGYEIHMGQTTSRESATFLREIERNPAQGPPSDGAVSDDGRVVGTYLHGLFDEPAGVRGLLEWLGRADAASLVEAASADLVRDGGLDRWAAHLRRHVDLERLFASIGCTVSTRRDQ